MMDSMEESEFHFLEEEESDMTGDVFLKRRLSLMLDHFSYKNLSGLSVDGINEKITYYNFLREDIDRRFTNPDSIWADLQYAEFLTEGEYELYEPLTENQRMEIIRVCDQISGNFDKAHEDAQDRKFERIGTLMSSIPMMGRIKEKV